MRFWITKSSEVPVREQLMRQVILAILSDDLPAGQRLPSIRAVAQRYDVHSNTVSAAYHDLLGQGWLELRRGSGMYVREARPVAESNDIDGLLLELLRAARGQGHQPDAVLRRLSQLVVGRSFSGVSVVEPEPGLREILRVELAELVSLPVKAIGPSEIDSGPDSFNRLVVTLPTRSERVRASLASGTPHMTLRLRSVRESLELEARPSPNAIIGIVSASPEFRSWSRALLIAVGLEPDCLCEIDTSLVDWRERASAASVRIADVVAARGLSDAAGVKVFRVIADSSIAEIKQLCGF